MCFTFQTLKSMQCKTVLEVIILQSVTVKGRSVAGRTVLLPFDFANIGGGAKKKVKFILTAVVSGGIEKGEVGNDGYKLGSQYSSVCIFLW